MPTTAIACPTISITTTEPAATAQIAGRIAPESTPQRRAAQRHLALLDAVHPASGQHARRVATLSGTLAAAAGCDTNTIETARLAGLLHDIGKAAIDPALLDAPRRLTPREQTIVDRHAPLGAAMLEGDALLAHVQQPIARHHSRWESGGADIPLIARIIAVVDAWDAMVSPRPYACPMDPADAQAELVRCAGTQFDPDLVRVFLATLPRRVHLARSA